MQTQIIKLLILAFSIYFVGRVTKLFIIENFFSAIIAAFVLGLVNVFVKPVLIFFTIPITFITFGIFLIFINGICLRLVSAIVPKFKVEGCLNSTVAAILIALTNILMEYLLSVY